MPGGVEDALLLESAGDDAGALDAMCVRREAGEPLEHVVGWVRFGGLRLGVGPGVFVPRQRTRALAREAVREARSRPGAVVVEACCGVGPVAATVLRTVPGARVHACDVDARALAYAAANLGSAGAVHLGRGLRALPAGLRGTVDVVAAVPPYVPTGSRGLMPREAREHEPQEALFAGPDGLDVVRALVAEAPAWLRAGGVLVVEMHPDQARAVAAAADRQVWAGAGLVGRDPHTGVLRLVRSDAGQAQAGPA